MIAKVQLGKRGITENFIETLKAIFKRHKIVKIALLKSCSRDREEVKKTAEQICNKLDERFKYKIIGFTIVLKRC